MSLIYKRMEKPIRFRKAVIIVVRRQQIKMQLVSKTDSRTDASVNIQSN